MLFSRHIEPRHATGCVGLLTMQGKYRFRDIKVTAPDGQVLLEGLPDVDSAWNNQ
jgi:hypothetical protein